MITGYKDLKAYQKSYGLVIEIYRLTKRYPKEEMYALTSQLKRAAYSIPLNIAEGYAKKDSAAEFKRFLQMAKGSATEAEVLLSISKDLGYISAQEYEELTDGYEEVIRIVSGMIQKWKQI